MQHGKPCEAAPEKRDTGIISDRLRVLRNRRLNALSILIPLLGASIGVLGFGLWPTPVTLSIFILFFLAEIVGLTLGLHRYFSHRAFETKRAFRAVLAVFGSWAFQGPIDRWVADHRRHHRYTDQRFDPHSPYWVGEKPAPSRWRGLLHAHLTWMLTGQVSDEGRYAIDIRRDPITSWCSRHYWLLCASSIAVPALLGGALGGAPEALRCAVWAGCLRVSVLHQLTWAVNSIGHAFGHRVAPDESADQSRDNPILTVLLLGEGLHGYHHHRPRAAVNEPAALDVMGQLVLGLEKLGIVWSVKRYAPEPSNSRVPFFPSLG